MSFVNWVEKLVCTKCFASFGLVLLETLAIWMLRKLANNICAKYLLKLGWPQK